VVKLVFECPTFLCCFDTIGWIAGRASAHKSLCHLSAKVVSRNSWRKRVESLHIFYFVEFRVYLKCYSLMACVTGQNSRPGSLVPPGPRKG